MLIFGLYTQVLYKRVSINLFDYGKINMQLNIVWVVGCRSSFLNWKEVIIMEVFLEFLREALKGIVRATSAHFFQKKFLDNKKTTPRRRKQKGGSRKK